MTVKLTEWDSSKYLTTKESIAEYLSAALEANDFNHFKYALSQVAKSKGMTEISKKTGIPRITLYKMLDEKGNPEFKTMITLINSLDVNLTIIPKKSNFSKKAYA